MSSKRARKPKTEINAAAELLASLKFISAAQRKDGLTYQTSCYIANGFIYAFDGTLSAGCKIEEDLTACPHTLQLIEALSRCGSELAIAQVDAGRLSIKSGPFRAFVPCADPLEIVHSEPDEALYPVDSRLIAALERVSPLADEKAHDVWASSISLQAGAATASDGKFLIQYWHGLELPTMTLPKASTDAFIKAKKAPVKFGYSGKSFTLWFEDNSWIKTLLIDEEWPDIAQLLDGTANAWPIPDKFFEAVKAVAPFNKDGSVYFVKGAICSASTEEVGTKYDIEGLPIGKIFGAKYLLMLKPLAERVDFDYENKCIFFGENLRGLIMGRVL